VEASRKDVDLLLLGEASATVHECQEAALVVSDRGVPLQLDQLAQCVAAERWPKPLVDKLHKLCPIRRAVIALDEGEPLRRVANHVEHRQEHPADVLGFLDAEELLTSIEQR
jgi:hypothetical protein